MKSCFSFLDPNHKGYITKENLLKIVENRASNSLSNQEIEKLFSAIDQKNTGRITYLEFSAFFERMDHLEIQKLFEVWILKNNNISIFV